jgi:hypothetical protein
MEGGKEKYLSDGRNPLLLGVTLHWEEEAERDINTVTRSFYVVE